MTEFTGRPWNEDETARLLDQLATSPSVLVIDVPTGAGKSAILGALLAQPQASVGQLRRGILVLDDARDDLTSTDAKPPSVVALHFGTSRSTAGLYSESTPPPAETPLATARIAAPEIVPDRPWSPRAELSASLIRSLHSYLLAPIDAPRYPHGLLPQRQYVASVAVAIDQTILSRLRQNLLRLIDGTRAILRLILIRVLSALSRHPDAINVALVLLAASRCFGHRTDPSDRTLPVLTSMSVVTGRLPAF